MGRIRTIKPEFFLSEQVASCAPLSRILFAGLWTLADREGRLGDQPNRIKAQVLPYDKGDPEAMLRELHDAKLICRYEAEGEKYIAIPKFQQHQRPHPKEAPSLIPPCNFTAGYNLSTESNDLAATFPVGREGKGRSLGKESQEGKENGASLLAVEFPEKLAGEPFESAWKDLLEYRKQSKFKPWTELTVKARLKEFERYGPRISAAAIRKTIENGWQGIFCDKITDADCAKSTGKRVGEKSVDGRYVLAGFGPKGEEQWREVNP